MEAPGIAWADVEKGKWVIRREAQKPVNEALSINRKKKIKGNTGAPLSTAELCLRRACLVEEKLGSNVLMPGIRHL